MESRETARLLVLTVPQILNQNAERLPLIASLPREQG